MKCYKEIIISCNRWDNNGMASRVIEMHTVLVITTEQHYCFFYAAILLSRQLQGL